MQKHSVHYNSKNFLKYTRLQVKLTRSFQFCSKQLIDSFLNILFSFIYSTIFFSNSINIFITVRNILRKLSRLHVKSTRSLRFRSEDFSIRFKFARHEFLYLRVFFWWYDFDFFFVEVVIHIRRATSQSVNHSTLFRRNTSFSFQSNYDRRWFFRTKQIMRFECYEMFHLFLEIIYEIFRLIIKSSFKFEWIDLIRLANRKFRFEFEFESSSNS